MSETNPTPEELVEEMNYGVEDADVILSAIDPTLTIAGEAADAKATGDAINAVLGNLRVNTKAPVNNVLTLYGGDIYVNDTEGAQTITEAIEAANDKSAADIMYNSTTMTTVADELTNINTALESSISDADIDEIVEEVFGGGE